MGQVSTLHYAPTSHHKQQTAPLDTSQTPRGLLSSSQPPFHLGPKSSNSLQFPDRFFNLDSTHTGQLKSFLFLILFSSSPQVPAFPNQNRQTKPIHKENNMYPKVKVRQYALDDDHLLNDRARSSLLDKFQSFSIHAPLQDEKPEGTPSTPAARIPKSHVPRVRRPDSAPKVRSMPRVTKENSENSKILEEDKPNIRFSSIMRPRAVVSSPDNDAIIGSKNRVLQGRHSASGHTAVQNRHKSLSHISAGRGSKNDAGSSPGLGGKNVSARDSFKSKKILFN